MPFNALSEIFFNLVALTREVIEDGFVFLLTSSCEVYLYPGLGFRENYAKRYIGDSGADTEPMVLGGVFVAEAGDLLLFEFIGVCFSNSCGVFLALVDTFYLENDCIEFIMTLLSSYQSDADDF